MIDQVQLSNTVNSAYPAARAAKSPVNKIEAPIPTYLEDSVEHFFKREWLAPAQDQKKVLIRCMAIQTNYAIQGFLYHTVQVFKLYYFND